MSRQNYTSGQEIISEDLNSMQGRAERGMFDKVLFEMLQRKTNAFFQNSFQVLRQTNLDMTVKAGFGFQLVDTGSKEPIHKPLHRSADVTVTINTPDASNGRIDIISVRQNRAALESATRKFKDEFSDAISNTNTVIVTDWFADIQYTPGTPAGSPVAPATPAGYIKVAEIAVSASTGVANQAAITDKREKLPFCTAVNPTGSMQWDAVVGDVTQLGVTHASLKLALDNASDGWRIFVMQSEVVDTTPVVNNNNVEVVFKRGASLTRGTATIGLQIDGDDVKIVNARVSGFNVGGDNGIKVSATAARTILDAPRFLNCATTLNDLGADTFTNIVYVE